MTTTAATLGTADSALFLRAPCVGRHDLTDPRDEREPADEVATRHHLALALCAVCPCTAACTAIHDALPRQHRGGVWAGRSTELPDLHLTKETSTMPTPPLPRRVRTPLAWPRLDPADRPDPAALAEERLAANGRRTATTKRTATTTETSS